MIYFIADTHFGHRSIVYTCRRPFAEVTEMNEAMIAVWNDRVREGDTVYILGDMFYRCRDPEPILRRLRGKKRLILGNHDPSWTGAVAMDRYFASVDEYLVLSDGKRELTLCHYPLLTWKHEKRSYMIHGHIHNRTDQDFWPLLRERERVLNAGADVNGYGPVPFEELAENNRRFKEAHP